MKKLKVYILIAFFFFAIRATAQIDSTYLQSPNMVNSMTLGLGMGLDYGGYGLNMSIYPTKNFGIFLGGGWALAEMGYNLGLKFRCYPNGINSGSLYVVGMYGYNSAIVVTNMEKYNKLFYGASFGVGFDFRFIKTQHLGYWSLAVLVPIRGSEVQNYIDDLTNNKGVEFKSGLNPVLISIGYKFIIH